jgi:hypothetical protein
MRRLSRVNTDVNKGVQAVFVVAKGAMGFDQNYRTLRTIRPDPQNPDEEVFTDFKVCFFAHRAL